MNPSPSAGATDGRRVPWRPIWAAIASVLGVGLTIVTVLELGRLLVWLVVAGFLAVALNPAVDLFVRRLHLRRGVATLLVLFIGVAVAVGVVVLLVRPLVQQGSNLADDLPEYIDDAESGKGPVGEFLNRYGLDERIREQSDQISEDIGSLGSQSIAVLGTIGSTIVATVTILVLTVMLLLEGDRVLAGLLAAVPAHHREHVARVSQDCARAVTGYVTGNLVISIVAGLSSFAMLLATGTPFAGLLALWVGITDLVPLVGATLGAVVVVVVAFVASPTAGIVAVVFFVVYQQVENHVLQPVVQSRTVRLNPLAVLVAALAGVELAGLLGALLAIPVAGVVAVILRDISRGMRPDLQGVTIGADEVPVDQAEPTPGFLERDAGGQIVTPRERADAIDTGRSDPVGD